MNVLMVCHHRRFKVYPRAGALAKHLARRGHRVTLLCISDHGCLSVKEEQWEGVRLVETPDLLAGSLRSGWDPWDTFRRIRFLRDDSSHYDIVHALETRPATIYPVLSLLRRRPTPWLTDWIDWWGRGGLITDRRPRWYQLLFGTLETYYEEAFRAHASGLTVISRDLAVRAQSLGVPADRICWIPGGANTDLFRPVEKQEARRLLGLPAGAPILVFSGVDVRIDFRLVLETFVRVRRQRPDARLLVTGGDLGPWAATARAYGILDGIVQAGLVPLPELPAYLSAADVLLLPFADRVANLGRWPNKIGDYMAIGRPIVTNPTGEMRRLLEQQPVGLLAAPEAEDMAAKVQWLLDHPAEADAMGQHARRLARTTFNWDHIIGRLERFYLQTIEHSNATPAMPTKHAELDWEHASDL